MWWTFLFWLPDFFSRRYGVDLKNYGPPLVAIYVMADIGSVLGGWRSSFLLKRGYPLGRSRKLAIAHDRVLYRTRNRIERCFNKLKHFRHFATRFDRRAVHFLAFISLAAAMLWLR